MRGFRVGEGSAWHSGLAPKAAEAGGGTGACRRAATMRAASYWREEEDAPAPGGLGS